MELSEEQHKVLELLIVKLEQDDINVKDKFGEYHHINAIEIINGILMDDKI